MKNLFTLICALFLTISTMQAQTKVFGTVIDTTGVTLTGATVMVLQAKDSLLSGFALVDPKGAFEVTGVKAGDYIVQVSFLGYGVKKIPITLAGEKEKDLGKIVMKEQTAMLNEYVVEGERAPMTIKKDTVEFNAAAFKVQPNSTVEELLKRLPGVEVEKDGNVKAQGENVTRVLVNGKEFFGRDPKTATRNLPADAIDKIQVFDKMTDVAEFTGVDDGQREKTINLTLRPDRQNGTFGNFRLGGGGPEQFDLGGNMNRFSKTGQISIIGSANNVNRNGFSINEYLDFSGGGGMGGGGMGGGGRGGIGGGDVPINFGRNYGFTTFYSGGLNFSKDFGKKTKFNGSYLYSGFKKETDQKSRTENFLEKSAFIQSDTSEQDETSDVHRLNFTLDHDLDSTQSIRVVSRVSFSQNGSDVLSNSFSTNEQLIARNSSDQTNASDGSNVNLNTTLLYRKKFGRRGRNLSTTFTLNNVDGNTDRSNLSQNLFFGTDGSITNRQDYNQITDAINDRMSYNARLSFTEPLSRGKFLELNYSYNHRGNNNNSEVYDVLPTGQLVLNQLQTNHILSDFNFHNGGFNFRIANPKLNFTTGLAVQYATLEGDLRSREQRVEQEFTNLLPSVRLRYNFSQMRSFNFDYSTDINEPAVTQLQPAPDLSNPLSIYYGNPNLKPEYGHRFTMRYNHFNQFNFTNFFGFANFTYTNNRIQTAQTINEETFITERTPINVPDDYRFISRLNYGGRLKSIKTRFSFNAGYNYNWGTTFVNAARNFTKTQNPTVGVTLDNQKKEKWDWNLGYTLNYSNTAYSLNSERNQDYFSYTYTVGVRKFFLKDKLNIETDLDYSQFRGLGEEFDQDIPIWNAAISMYFLKANKGQLKFGAYDILNQNQGISRTVQLNYFQDQDVNSLARYFMFSFIYSMKGFQKGNANGGNRMNIQMR